MIDIPRVPVFERRPDWGEPVHITLLSDLHVESSVCDIAGLQRLLRDRASLPNHSVVILGDLVDMVGPRDLKRYRQSCRIPEMSGRDDWINVLIDHVVETLSIEGITYDFFGIGNHEDEWLKRHGLDILSIVAHKLGAVRCGYSGIADYRIIPRGRSKHLRFRLGWHHGAWGGRHAKGFMGAKEWAFRFPGWDVYAYGHCHSSRIDPEVAWEVRGKELVERRITLVNCGSWTQPLDGKDARVTHYTERRGHPPQPRTAPLVKIVPRIMRGKPRLEISVEV